MYLHSQWKNYWIEEIFSDMFACYTLGPAYVWAHLHLVTKKTDDVYALSQKHPSDDLRMNMLLIGIRKVGFKEDAERILAQWKKMPFVENILPANEYVYAYSEELMDLMAGIILKGLRASSFAFLEHGPICPRQSLVHFLKLARVGDLKDPLNFGEWEQKCVDRLRSAIA